MLTVEHLSVAYGAIRAVNDLSLTLEAGAIGCLLGANGAGKSSTLLALSGILKPTAGRVQVDGRDLAGAAPADIVAAGLVQVPEGRHVFPRMSVAENLALGAYSRRHGAAIASDRERVFELFPRLGERLGQAAGTLSGGEQQMLAIGRALMARPRILLLDEPSLGLAPLISQQIFATLRTIADDGQTILLVEQNAVAALDLADHGWVLENGRLVLAGSADQLRADPALRAAYLGG